MWRKNRMKTHSDDCVGIDLNRNWGYEWDGEETNRNPCSEIYSGPAPGSELEIKAIVRFVTDNLPRIKVRAQEISSWNRAWNACPRRGGGTWFVFTDGFARRSSEFRCGPLG